MLSHKSIDLMLMTLLEREHALLPFWQEILDMPHCQPDSGLPGATTLYEATHDVLTVLAECRDRCAKADSFEICEFLEVDDAGRARWRIRFREGGAGA